MIEIDVRQAKAYEQDLKYFKRTALPYATRETVNSAAFETRTRYQANAKRELTLRNKWTTNSIRVDRARTLDIGRMAAVTGSTADYMDEQEFGGVVRPKRGQNQPIATGYAAGQKGARPRTRLPRKPNKRSNIQLNDRRRKAKTRQQRNVFAVQDAVTTGRRYVFLDWGPKQGIYKVIGGRKSFKRGWPKGAKIEMVWDLSRKSVVVPRTPLLKPATDDVRPLMPAMYAKALRYQLRRHGVKGY